MAPGDRIHPPQISDAQLVTLAVMQALLGFTSKTRWLRFATTLWGSKTRCSVLTCWPGRIDHPGQRHKPTSGTTGRARQSQQVKVYADF